MFSNKRLLKKEKKQVTKKRLLFLSLGLGGMGVLLIGIGVVMLLHEPLFISPLPIVGSPLPTNKEKEDQKTIRKKLKEYDIEYDSVKLLGQSLFLVSLKDNGDVILTSRKDILKQMSSLQVIYSRLTMEGKKFKRLDMRYDRPVIVLR